MVLYWSGFRLYIVKELKNHLTTDVCALFELDKTIILKWES